MVPGRGGADIGEPLNYSTTIAIPKAPSVIRDTTRAKSVPEPTLVSEPTRGFWLDYIFCLDAL